MHTHTTVEDERGWHKAHGKPRNMLNKGGSKRIGTLGYRLNDRNSTSRVHNPRAGHVNPPAPLKARAQATAMASAQCAETWASKRTDLHNGPTMTTYTFRDKAYATWEEWNEAVEGSA